MAERVRHIEEMDDSERGEGDYAWSGPHEDSYYEARDSRYHDVSPARSRGSMKMRVSRVHDVPPRVNPYPYERPESARRSRDVLPGRRKPKSSARVEVASSTALRSLQEVQERIRPRSPAVFQLIEESLTNEINFSRYAKTCEVDLSAEFDKLQVSDIRPPPVLAALFIRMAHQINSLESKYDAHMNNVCKSCEREAQKVVDIYATDLSHCQLDFKSQWFRITPELEALGLRRCHMLMAFQSTRPATMRGRSIVFVPFERRISQLCDASIKLVIPNGEEWCVRSLGSADESVKVFPRSLLDNITAIVGDLVAKRADGSPVELIASGLFAQIRKKLVDALARSRRRPVDGPADSNNTKDDRSRTLKTCTADEYQQVLDTFRTTCAAELIVPA